VDAHAEERLNSVKSLDDHEKCPVYLLQCYNTFMLYLILYILSRASCSAISAQKKKGSSSQVITY